MNRERTTKKIFRVVAILVMVLLFVFNGPTVYALDFSTPPPAPTSPPAPTAPPAPTPPPEPTPPPAWTPPPAPTLTPPPAPTPLESVTPPPGWEPTPVPTAVQGTSEFQDSGLTGQSSDGAMGDAAVLTGDATTSGAIITDANTNTDLASPSDGNGSVSITNDGNGSGSTNSGSATIIENNNLVQDNSAIVVNDQNLSATTGGNSVSGTTGGSSTIETGDANVSGTIITAVNTNVDGVLVSEFNVLDDSAGDIILDFGSGCVVGCSAGDTSVTNSENGSDSTNSGDIDSIVNNNTFQTNDATLENNMTLVANSGDNLANNNTGGDSTVTTGDANVAANILTFANNNLAGGVVYAVINIFGDLVGDIIFPESAFTACCGPGDTSVVNSDNGSGSINDGTVTQNINNNTLQFNNAEIENNLVFDANSGGNSVSDNTNGNSSVITGDTSIDAQVVTIANNNLAGGNFWLVIVNEAGRWIGRILGSPDESNLGGSEEFEFIVNEFGEIMIVNSGNGADSQNSGTVNQTTNNTLIQTNDAHIVNDVNLSANSGGNSASRNTNGDSSIETGDANIIANIVNFVNNNITGGGKLFVAVVNVFGSWLGNFVGPGFVAEPESQVTEASVGGVDVASIDSASQNSQNQGQSTSASNSNEEGGTPINTHIFGGGATGENFIQAQVAGFSNIVEEAQEAGRKVVNINLAWVLYTLFPVGAVSMMLRRRHIISKFLKGKSEN